MSCPLECRRERNNRVRLTTSCWSSPRAIDFTDNRRTPYVTETDGLTAGSGSTIDTTRHHSTPPARAVIAGGFKSMGTVGNTSA